jgi:uncharacterized membrane protein YhdT
MKPFPDRTSLTEDFEHDSRYRISLREAWLCVAYWALFTLVMTAIAWGVAGNRNPEETTYIAGFPEWFFWTGMVVVAIFCLIPYLMIRFLFTEVDLEPRPQEPAAAATTSEGSQR